MFRTAVFLSILLFHSASGLADDSAQNRADGNNAFALDLYNKLLESQELRDKSGNLFFSPHSLSVALAMTWAGARGETEKQMAGVLHLDRAPEEEHRAFACLRTNLDSADALWMQRGMTLLPEYLDLLGKYYEGSASEVDFAQASEAARKTINAWVADRTRDKIKELLQAGDLDPTTELVLTNALYFNENWARGFDPKYTRDHSFKTSPDGSVQVPMMCKKAKFGYVAEDGFEILRIPFAEKKHSMIFLLPREADGLEAQEKKLTAKKLSAWFKDLREQEMGILIPRFNMTSRFRLENVLAAMGMPDAFDPGRADFSGMTGRRGLFIDKVIHQATLEVSEEGAEAAAATAVMTKRGGPVFRADHPFLFFIRDDRTGAVLFMGRMMNPAM